MKPLIRTVTLVLATAVLIACGGGGGGGSTQVSGPGTSSGTITGFGSVILNDNGRFVTTSSSVSIDDSPGSESELKLGMQVQVDISSTTSSLSSGVADTIRVDHEIKGPVTSVTPLEVFGQPVVITGDTLVQDSSQDGRDSSQTINPATLSLGDEVEVAGRRDDQGVILASRLELKLGGLAEWKLVGPVSSLAGSSFSIVNQAVDIGVTPVRDCTGALADGDRVEIKALPMAFSPGFTLNTVTDVECKPDALVFGGTATGVIQGEFEGFVTSVAVSGASGSFTLGDQTVTVDSSTAVEGGAIEDLVVGVKLDARGALNLSTGILAANRIRFRETRMRLEGPATLTASDSVELLGLTVNVTAQTEDDASLVGSSAASKQIRVRGFIDRSGALFATEVDDRGTADLLDTRVRGPVDSGSIDTGANVFTLFGITIDTDTALSFQIEGVVGNVTQQAFFDALAAGVEVDAEDGDYDSVTNTITNARLKIER